MSLGQPESVPLARLRRLLLRRRLEERALVRLLQELEYVDRWPSEAPPPPDDDDDEQGPRTPRIGPALSLDEDDDDGARVVETVDLTTPPRPPREAHHRQGPGVAGPRRDAARRGRTPSRRSRSAAR